MNYCGVRHHDSEFKAKDVYSFYQHQQSQEHAEAQLKNIKAENFNNSKMSNCTEHK